MTNGMKPFWTRVYRKNIEKMIGVCYRYILDRPTAEDLAHDAFLTAIEKADTFRGLGSFEGWLMRIASRNALLYLRKQGRILPLGDDPLVPDEGVEDEDELSSDDRMAAIRKADFSQEEILDAMAQLPDHHRTVLNLYVFERLSHKQIAEMMGISPNTSKSHLLRARKELQKILFNKTKERKRPIMILFPLFIHREETIDRYCRSQLKGFAIPSQRSLKEDAVPASSKVSPKLWLYAHRVPVALGIAFLGAVAALACFLYLPSLAHSPAGLPQESSTDFPQVVEPQPVVVLADSLEGSDTEGIAPFEEERKSAVARRPAPEAFSSAPAPAAREVVAPVHNPEAESDEPAPVVVKKVRRINHTVVIKDSTK